MANNQSPPMEVLDLARFEDLRRSLPEHYADHLTPIPAMVGTAWELIPFSERDSRYRVAVDNGKGYWMAKCTCPGWHATKKTRFGKTPCVHVVAAMLVDKRFNLVSFLAKLASEMKHRAGLPPAQRGDAYEGPSNTTTSEAQESPPEVLPPLDPVEPRRPQPRVQPAGQPPAQVLPAVPPNTHTSFDMDDNPMVRPVATLADAQAVFEAFQAAKLSLLTKADVQSAGDGNFLKKDAWRKLALYFGITCQKLGEGMIESPGGRVWGVTYRATGRNGTFQDGTGYCSWTEEFAAGRAAAAENKAAAKLESGEWDEGRAGRHVDAARAKLEHDVRSTAETRAKTRAISDLLGGGEVTNAERARMKS